MNTIIKISVIALTMIMWVGCSSKKKENGNKDIIYTCPMHPEVVSDKPWVCPICKMDLVPQESRKSEHDRHIQSDSMTAPHSEYTCPMHPEVVSDKPGICPICKMDLVPQESRKSEHDGHKRSGSMTVPRSDEETVFINAHQQYLAGIAVERASIKMLGHVVTAPGILVIPENHENIVSARFGGRVEKLYASETGKTVHKGDVLFDVYSPDLLKAQSDYIISLSPGGTTSVQEMARVKLQLMGLTDAQIQSIAEQKQPNLVVQYHAPFAGTITKKNLKNGVYFNEGDLLYELVDYTTLWNISEIYEVDAERMKKGLQARLTIQGFQESVPARISFIYPNVESSSRTVKVRMEVQNHKLKFKPNMFTTSEIEMDRMNSVVVPENAVVFTGKHAYVWIKTMEESFTLRKIITGNLSDGMYQILDGVNENEMVASSGGFFLDAERKLRSKGGMHKHDL